MMRKAATYILLAAGALLTAFPFVWMLSTALKSEAEALAVGLDSFPDASCEQFRRVSSGGTQFGTYFTIRSGAFSVTAPVVVTSSLRVYLRPVGFSRRGRSSAGARHLMVPSR